ncbi:MAG: UDP-diphosphatase [Bacteroidetes bacterium]|nr:undecaprenyl-diphosphate phosphatase [Bacteroidia bacterium]PCH66957.1 MAG: UDP-diphosphatase [Bacteroidota bacterium]
MSPFEAFILGLVQALTEFLPVSSSGHIELGKAFMDVTNADDAAFTIIVHAATTFSIIVVYWKDITTIIGDLLKFQWNESTEFTAKIILSMIPVALVGVLFKDHIDLLFQGSVFFVGCMLILTGIILALTTKIKTIESEITYGKAFIIGVAQAVAVLPGISRSGSTIATALLLGSDKEKAAKFSFLMVIAPILGMTILEVKDLLTEETTSAVGTLPLSIGFVTSFIFGIIACKWMINIVKKGKLIYFAIYCWIVGIIAIIIGL